MKVKSLCLLICLLWLVGGCGSRLPEPATSQRVIAKHFKKYGKKYKETDFGHSKVTQVEISGTEEIQKDLAVVDAFTYLSDGPVYRVRVTLRKKAFGWRYVQWENLGAR